MIEEEDAVVDGIPNEFNYCCLQTRGVFEFENAGGEGVDLGGGEESPESGGEVGESVEDDHFGLIHAALEEIHVIFIEVFSEFCVLEQPTA